MSLFIKNISREKWVDPRSEYLLRVGSTSIDLELGTSIYDLRGFEAGIIADKLEVIQDDTGIFTHLTKLPVV